VEVFDKAGIKAQIERSGSSLAKIALAAGIPSSTVRGALRYPIPAGNRAIAKFLKQPLHVLWPAWFDAKGSIRPGVSSLKLRRAASSQNRRDG
jgi:lambda repressor-like predicted transcriptional regulator